MVNNGSLTYDHDRDGTHTQLAGCEGKFRNVDHDTHISIRYENEILTVQTDIDNKNDWKLCFSSARVVLPTGYYFGASAETGDLSDNHDILSFKFYEITPTDVNNVNYFIHSMDLTESKPSIFLLNEQQVRNAGQVHGVDDSYSYNKTVILPINF